MNKKRIFLAETLRTQRNAELLFEFFSFNYTIPDIALRFLINNISYRTTTLRALRPCASARKIGENIL